MKLNNRFVLILSILLVTRYTINVKSLNTQFLSVLKDKLLNRSNTWDSKTDSSSRPRRIERVLDKLNSENDDKFDKSSRSTLSRVFEKFTDPLSRDFPKNFRRNYAYFLVLFVLLVIYAVVGYHRNKKIATELSLAVEPILEEHFAYVERDPKLLDVRGWSQFEMYASGRTSCRGMLIKLDLLKRQCFWHENVLTIFLNQKDLVTYEILFETLDNFMFAVCKKENNKAFVNSYPHLLMFTNVHEYKEVPDTLRAYLDSNDKSLVQFGSYILHQFNPYINNLEHLYISDLDSTDSTLTKKPRLQCRFKLTKNREEFENLTKLVIHVTDCAKNFNLVPKAREALLKERSELELAYNKVNKSARDNVNDGEQEITSDKVKKHEERLARKNKPVTNIKIRKVK